MKWASTIPSGGGGSSAILEPPLVGSHTPPTTGSAADAMTGTCHRPRGPIQLGAGPPLSARLFGLEEPGMVSDAEDHAGASVSASTCWQTSTIHIQKDAVMQAITVRDRDAGVGGLSLTDLPYPHPAQNDVIV